VAVSINYRMLGLLPPPPGESLPIFPERIPDWLPAELDSQGRTIQQFVDTIAAAVEDQATAVNWLVANAASYNIDPGMMAIGGYSAGAISSLALGVGAVDGASAPVRAVLSVAGGLFGWETAVDPNDPGVFIMHGTADVTVPYAEAGFLQDALTTAGVPHESWILPGQAHAGLTPIFVQDPTQVFEFMIDQLTPVPEPSTFVLAGLGIGFGLLCLWRKRRPAACVLPIVVLALCLTVSSAAHAVTIDTVPVGNPGNAADSTGYGAVSYAYNIGTYEVTNSQYAEFLNAKDPTGIDQLGLVSNDLLTYGGIERSFANPDGSKYFAKTGSSSTPVTFVSWYHAIRFANWLHNGQGSGDTESGAYTLGSLGPGGVPTDGNSIARNPGATVFIPSEDEWYKAAYYNPADDSYFEYPTSSDTAPTATTPPGLGNSANYDFAVGSVTNIGAYGASASPYGTFDQGGNAAEWFEGLVSVSLRGKRGGSYVFGSSDLSSSSRYGFYVENTISDVGFRVATVPEPSSLVLAGLGIGFGLLCLWRKRRAAVFVLPIATPVLCLGAPSAAPNRSTARSIGIPAATPGTASRRSP
jgi:Sulfatase-modifying factor enzyme 1/BD-FAE/PEP-CTERM motif